MSTVANLAASPPSGPETLLLLINAAAVIFMAGLIWTFQVIHYPLLTQIGADAFPGYATDHNRLFIRVAGPMVLLAGVSGLLLLRFRPTAVPLWAVIVGLALFIVVVISTVVFQAPDHERLTAGFDQAVIEHLIATNWIRTVAWSLYGLLDLWLLWRVVRGE